MVVKEETMLNYADIGNNNNKFYHIELREQGGIYEVYAEYGRVGARNPSVWRKEYMGESSAKSEYNKKLRSKIKKGYVEVALAGLSDTEDIVVKEVDEKGSVKERESKVDKEVLKLIETFLGDAKSYVKKNVQTPLGALSKKQTSSGRKALKAIQETLGKDKESKEINVKMDLESLSNEFYRAIPIVFGSRPNKRELIIDTQQKVQKYVDLLDVIDSLVNTVDATNIEQSYLNLGLDISVLTKDKEEYKKIEEGMVKNRGDNHHFKINVENVYEVNKGSWDSGFNPYGVETKLLYHGSRTENYMKILQSGLVANPQGVHITGKMFGQGIYFADCSTKSAQYCAGFGNRKSGKYYMMICEVATGKEYELEQSNSRLYTAPRGYNSVKGVKGKYLRHNEYIVYHDNQSRIRYIVEFTM